jgi:hypothetical protein
MLGRGGESTHASLTSTAGLKSSTLCCASSPDVQGPLTLGYAEIRDIHLRHHSHLGSSADPESYLIAASPGAAFVKALFANELGMETRCALPCRLLRVP